MKILFVCKYNRFRSKVAEAYFKKKNKNKNIKVSSAGIIEVNVPWTPIEKERNEFIKRKFGLRIFEKSRGINVKLLEGVDKIIITANDVPKIIFNYSSWKDKVVVWKIPDELGANKKNIIQSSRKILKNVDMLIKELEGTL